MSSEPNIPSGRLRDDEPGGSSLVPAFTLVVWVSCVAVGLTGLLSTPDPARPTTQAAAVPPVTQVVDVSLEDSPPTPPPRPTAVPTAGPAAAATPVPLNLPAVPTAALPSAAIAFAEPVAGPSRIGTAVEAVAVGGVASPVVRHLSTGGGGGDVLPVATYPRDAPPGLTGEVTVRFTVAADGRVTRAWVVMPCRWPSLNDEAVKDALAVREPPGVAHIDEYFVTFQSADQ